MQANRVATKVCFRLDLHICRDVLDIGLLFVKRPFRRTCALRLLSFVAFYNMRMLLYVGHAEMTFAIVVRWDGMLPYMQVSACGQLLQSYSYSHLVCACVKA